jgi:hypothetical protein
MNVPGLIPGKTEFPSLGIKRPGRKANHAPPSSVMLRMCATTIMRPYAPTRRGASLSTGGQLCHDLVCSLLCLVGKRILTSCQPVLPEMKRATNTGTWRVHQVCCTNVPFDVFIAAVASLLTEGEWGSRVQFFGLRPQSWRRFFVGFRSPHRKIGILC